MCFWSFCFPSVLVGWAQGCSAWCSKVLMTEYLFQWLMRVKQKVPILASRFPLNLNIEAFIFFRVYQTSQSLLSLAFCVTNLRLKCLVIDSTLTWILIQVLSTILNQWLVVVPLKESRTVFPLPPSRLWSQWVIPCLNNASVCKS